MLTVTLTEIAGLLGQQRKSGSAQVTLRKQVIGTVTLVHPEDPLMIVTEGQPRKERTLPAITKKRNILVVPSYLAICSPMSKQLRKMALTQSSSYTWTRIRLPTFPSVFPRTMDAALKDQEKNEFPNGMSSCIFCSTWLQGHLGF